MEFVTAIATSIVGKIAEYTVAPVGRQFGYLFCYTSNIDDLKTRIEKLKNDKDRMQHRVNNDRNNCKEIEADVQSWQGRVDQIYNDVETFLKDEGHAKAKCSCGSFPRLVTRHQLSRKAKKMTTQVVCAIQDASKFVTISYLPDVESSFQITKGYETFGSRTEILTDIMKALRDVNASRIGVYGMGGIGKTMLAKEIARQAEKEKFFSKVVMTIISQTPNIKDIQKDIAEKLNLSFGQTESVDMRANLLRMRLKQEDKILLILDDIWGELDLLAIGIHFEEDRQGCKMLLTSRSLDVLCNFMGVENSFSIQALATSEATNLFKKIVGDILENADFNSLANQIIAECAGLPLAITTVAHALKFKNNLSIWKDALKRLKSSNPIESKRMYEKVYSSIKLSYNFLGSDEEVKSLLLLCSLHQEDENIMLENLMRYSVGWNLLQDFNTLEEARDRVVSLVDKLKSHCLLLDGDNYGGPSVKMHDVIRDVCLLIASEDKHMYSIADVVKLEEFLNKKKHREVKAISLLEHGDFGKLPERLECPKLELLLMSDYSFTSIPDYFFEQTSELQSLVLNHTELKSLPSSFHLLQNLETLCLRGSELEDVTCVGEIKNLKVLDLSRSTIKRLPRKIGELHRLRLLDLQGCYYLEVIEPNVISNLTRLEELYMAVEFQGWEVEEDGIDERRNVSLVELKNLQQLMVLHLSVRDAKAFPEQYSFSEKLERYSISVGESGLYSRDGISRALHLCLNQRSQLNALGLESLMKRSEYLWLSGFRGINNFVYDLDKEGFPGLKHLQFYDNDGVQFITMPQIHSSSVFLSLEILDLCRLTNLERICQGKFTADSFNNLREVNVRNCGRLKNLFPLSIVKRLRVIEVDECEMMEEIVTPERESDDHGMSNEAAHEVEFSELRRLCLSNLPNFVQFCSCEVEETGGSSSTDSDPKPLFRKKEFRTRHKLFLVSLLHGGQKLKILERNRVKDFSVVFGLGAAAWLLDVIMQVCNQNIKDSFVKSFRGDSYSLLIEVRSNRFGSFFQISKMENGRIGKVIIPEEGGTWRNLAQAISSLTRKQALGTLEDNIVRAKEVNTREPVGTKKYYPDRSCFQFARKAISLAVILYRNNIEDSWETIKRGLTAKLKRRVEITEIVADRAVLWCSNEGERRRLFRNPVFHVPWCNPIRVVPWQQNEHWKEIVFEGRDLWVGVEGIPLDWWNAHVIKVIGEMLGGLLDIGVETLSLTFLKYAKIRIKGPENGFIPSMLALPRGNDSVVLGVFPLNKEAFPEASLGPAGRHVMQKEYREIQERKNALAQEVTMNTLAGNIRQELEDDDVELSDVFETEKRALSGTNTKGSLPQGYQRFGGQAFGSSSSKMVWRKIVETPLAAKKTLACQGVSGFPVSRYVPRALAIDVETGRQEKSLDQSHPNDNISGRQMVLPDRPRSSLALPHTTKTPSTSEIVDPPWPHQLSKSYQKDFFPFLMGPMGPGPFISFGPLLNKSHPHSEENLGTVSRAVLTKSSNIGSSSRASSRRRSRKFTPKPFWQFKDGSIVRWEEGEASALKPSKELNCSLFFDASEPDSPSTTKSKNSSPINVYQRQKKKISHQLHMVPMDGGSELDLFAPTEEDSELEVSKYFADLSSENSDLLLTEIDNQSLVDGSTLGLEEIKTLFKDGSESETYFLNAEQESQCLQITPIDAVFPSSPSNKTVNLGGQVVEWKDLQEYLKSIKVDLIPATTHLDKDGSTKSGRQKKGARELRNLQFGVNYEKHTEGRDLQPFK